MTRRDLVFSWPGLPQYGARQLHAAFETFGETFPVLASPARVPIEGVEENLGSSVTWVDVTAPTSWHDLGMEPPRVFFQAGWSFPAFRSLAAEVRRAGGSVCLAMDNNWRGDVRQRAGVLAFRLRAGRHFKAALVPGAAGRRFARYLGFEDNRIWEGAYSADPAIFLPGPPLRERPKVILYVGQYIERKSCVPLADAFVSVSAIIPDWSLHMYGSGPLKQQLPHHPRVVIGEFMQPEHLAPRYRDARVFALPSYSESWGLVVHEACLSGCQLLISDKVGAAADFARPGNAFTFDPHDGAALRDALVAAASLDAAGLEVAYETSLSVAGSHTPQIFGRHVKEIYDDLAK